MKKIYFKQLLYGRAYVFVDVSNIYYSQKTLGWNIDYQKLLALFRNNGKLIASYFYTGFDPDNKKQIEFLEKMESFGYIVKKKEIKWIKDRNTRVVKGKGNLDIELALDLTHKLNDYDTAVLFSGDSDFTPAIAMVKKKKKRIIVISSRGHIARELIQMADTFIPFEKIRVQVERKKSPRTRRGKSSDRILSKKSRNVK